ATQAGDTDEDKDYKRSSSRNSKRAISASLFSSPGPKDSDERRESIESELKKTLEIKDKIIESLKRDIVEYKTASLEMEHKYESNLEKLEAVVLAKDQLLQSKEKQLQELSAPKPEPPVTTGKRKKKKKQVVAPDLELEITKLKDQLDNLKQTLIAAQKVNVYL